jgi:hypothetical protein
VKIARVPVAGQCGKQRRPRLVGDPPGRPIRRLLPVGPAPARVRLRLHRVVMCAQPLTRALAGRHRVGRRAAAAALLVVEEPAQHRQAMVDRRRRVPKWQVCLAGDRVDAARCRRGLRQRHPDGGQPAPRSAAGQTRRSGRSARCNHQRVAPAGTRWSARAPARPPRRSPTAGTAPAARPPHRPPPAEAALHRCAPPRQAPASHAAPQPPSLAAKRALSRAYQGAVNTSFGFERPARHGRQGGDGDGEHGP